MKQQTNSRKLVVAIGITALALAASLPSRMAGAQPAKESMPVRQPAPGGESMHDMPGLHEKRVVTVTGKEDWNSLRGFGKDSGMVAMMTLMMVGGSGMEHMKMAPMKAGTMNRAGMNADGSDRQALDFNVGGSQTWAPPAGARASQPAGPRATLNTPADTLKVGKNALEFTILDAAGRPISGAKVATAVAMTSMDMGTSHPKAQEEQDGHYATEAEFSMKGPWRVTLTVTPPDQKPFTQAFNVNVKQ